MFNHTILIEISKISRRTYFRYKQKLINQGVLSETKEQYFDDGEAKKIAEAMGFKLAFEVYINKMVKA